MGGVDLTPRHVGEVTLTNCVMVSNEKMPKMESTCYDVGKIDVCPCGLAVLTTGYEGVVAINCDFAGVLVRHGNSVRMVKVNTGKIVLLQGNGNKFENCKGDVVYDEMGTAELVDCEFGEIIKGPVPEGNVSIATYKTAY